MGSDWDELYDESAEDHQEIDELLREDIPFDDLHYHSVEMEAPGVFSEVISHHLAEQPPSEDLTIGEPIEDMEHWHVQNLETSCAIACQEFVADELLNHEYSEKEILDLAKENGWYQDGTSTDDLGKVLESLGLAVDRSYDCSFEDIEQTLNNGGKVIAAVNNDLLAMPELAILPFFDANHAVEVIGIDNRDPEKIKVILNDPGIKEGRGIEIDKDDFMNAWKTSGFFATTAYLSPTFARTEQN